MIDYSEMILYAVMAFAVALILPALGAFAAGVIGYIQSRKDWREVDAIVRSLNKRK